MKYTRLITGTEGLVITEDGGVVTMHHNDDHIISTYHGNRIEEVSPLMWEELYDGKQWLHDWKDKQEIDDEVVQDALEWLSPRDTDFVEQEYNSFVYEFNHNQNKIKSNR